jgi:hypothetical protein
LPSQVKQLPLEYHKFSGIEVLLRKLNLRKLGLALLLISLILIDLKDTISEVSRSDLVVPLLSRLLII